MSRAALSYLCLAVVSASAAACAAGAEARSGVKGSSPEDASPAAEASVAVDGATGGVDGTSGADAGTRGDASDLRDASLSVDAGTVHDATTPQDAAPLLDADPGDAGAVDAMPSPSDAALIADAAVDAATVGDLHYNPCPALGTPCRVMPLGDSITYGWASSTGGGFREEWYHRALTAGQSITFVGSKSNGPATVDGKPFPSANEGWVGITIDAYAPAGSGGIYPYVVEWMKANPADVITLLIGTNDIDQSDDIANAPARLALLIDRITSTAPSSLLVVGLITPTEDDVQNQKVLAYNSAIPALVQARASAGAHVRTLDLYSPIAKAPAFKTSLMYDKLHPNDSGYKVLGDAWYEGLSSLFR